MQRGPNGEKRPSDTVGAAVMVGKIATGEVEDKLPSKTRKGGLKGGRGRAKTLTPERRSEIARGSGKSTLERGIIWLRRGVAESNRNARLS